MQDKGILGKESSTEEEKSKIDQYTEELKTSTFGVFYVLLKNQETTYWKFLFILIFEYL